jgi:hypothetical protein
MHRLLDALVLDCLPDVSLPGPYFLDEELGRSPPSSDFYTDPSRVCLSRCSGLIVEGEAFVSPYRFRRTLVSGEELPPLAIASTPTWFYARPTGELLCVGSDMMVNLFDYSATSTRPRGLGPGRQDYRRSGFRIDSILAVGFSPLACIILGNTGDIFQFANVRKAGPWQRPTFGIGGADGVNAFIANIKTRFPDGTFNAIPAEKWSVHVVNTDAAPVVYAVWPGGIVRAAERNSQRYDLNVVCFAVSASSKYVAAIVWIAGKLKVLVRDAVTFKEKSEKTIETEFASQDCRLAWIGDAVPIVAHEGGLIILDEEEIAKYLDPRPLVFTDVDCCLYITPQSCGRIRMLPPTFVEFLNGYHEKSQSWEYVHCFLNRHEDPPMSKYGAVRLTQDERELVIQSLVDASYYFGSEDQLTLLNSAVFVWSLGTEYGYRHARFSFSNAHARHRILRTLASAGTPITSQQLDSLGLPGLIFCLFLRNQPHIAISIALSIPKTNPFAANAVTLVRNHAMEYALAMPDAFEWVQRFQRSIGINPADVARSVTSQGEKGKPLAARLIQLIQSWLEKALVYERIGNAEGCLDAAIKSYDHSDCLAQHVHALISGSGGSPDKVNDLLRRHEAAARFVYRDLRSRTVNDQYTDRLRKILLDISDKQYFHVRDLRQRLELKKSQTLEKAAQALADQGLIPSTTRWETVNQAIRWLLESNKEDALAAFTRQVPEVREEKVVVERLRLWARKADMRKARGDDELTKKRNQWMVMLDFVQNPKMFAYHGFVVELVMLHAPDEIFHVLQTLRGVNRELKVRKELLELEAKRAQSEPVKPKSVPAFIPRDGPFVQGWLAK